MKQSNGQKKRAWFLVGVVLLSISALWWLIFVIAIVSEPKDIVTGFIVWLLLSALPVAIGIYCVMHGRKARDKEVEQAAMPTHTNQPSVKPTREMQQRVEPAYGGQPVAEPGRTPRGVFSWLKDKLRDKTRDRLCTDLRAIGIKATLAERERSEELIGKNWKGKSKGLIEAEGYDIRWVNVLKQKGTGGSTTGGGSPDTYTNIYLVPVPLELAKRYREIKSVREKSVPLFGKVADIRWKSNLEGDLIKQLNEDISLKESLIRLKEDVTIRSFPEHQCYAIVSNQYKSKWFGAYRQPVTREKWDCYETIACHLLGSSGK